MKDKTTQDNVRIVKDFFEAMNRGDKQSLLALSAEDIEWIIPGEDWPYHSLTISLNQRL